MTTSSRLASMAAALFLASLALCAPAQADPDKCKQEIAKAAPKCAQKKLKIMQKCRDKVVKGDPIGPCPDAESALKIADAESKMRTAIAKKCGGSDQLCGGGGDDWLTWIGWDIGSCPNIEGGSCTNAIADCGDIGDCLACVIDAVVDQLIALSYDALQSGEFGTGSDVNKCQREIGKNVTKFFISKSKALAKCEKDVLKGNILGPCPDAVKAQPEINEAESKKITNICNKCGGGDKLCNGVGDFSPGAIGFAATCPSVTIPNGGGSCAGPISTLQDIVHCVDCVAEFKDDCIDPLSVPATKTYPEECVGKVPGPRDLFFANNNSFSSQEHQLCEGDGEGAFVCRDVFAATDTRDAVAGDFDEDGHLDVVLANDDQNQLCTGDGAGSFTRASIDPGALTTGVASGDFDEDGHLDVVFSNYSYGSEDTVCLGNGAGGFTCSDVSTAIDASTGVAAGDVDGDGHLDVVFANQNERHRVCLGDGAGTFTCSDVSTDTYATFGVALADFNEDGLDDALFANRNQRNRMCLATGGGAFLCGDVDTFARDSFAVVAGDVNGDNHVDAVFGNYGQYDQVCLGDGTGALSCADLSTAYSRQSFAATLADLDGDGDLDAAFANAGERNLYCENDGTGAFTCGDVGTATDFTNAVVAGRFFE